MEYNDETAKQIAEKWGVPIATLKTWKSRGSIPDKYKDSPIPNEDIESFLRLCLTLKDGRLDISEIERKTSVKLKSLANGDKAEITNEEFIRVRKYINELVVFIKRAKTLETLQDVIKHPAIKPLLVLKPLGRTQETYFSHLRNTAFRSIRSYSYDITGAVRLFYQFAEQIKV